MPQIVFDVSAQNLTRIVNAINFYHPADVGFTPQAWAKEWVRRMIIGRVQDHEKDLAVKSVNVQYDDTLLT